MVGGLPAAVSFNCLEKLFFYLFVFYYYLGVLKIPLTQMNMGILKKLAEAKGLKLKVLIASHKLSGSVQAKDQSGYEEYYRDR